MYSNLKKVTLLAGVLLLLVLPLVTCVAPPPPPPPPPKLPPPAAEGVIEGPGKLELSWPVKPSPVVFKGYGWAPNEIVVVQLVLPADVAPTVKGVEPGGVVGIAYGTADETGKFTAAVGAALHQVFMRGDPQRPADPTTSFMLPDPKTFKPLPIGIYVVKAIGSLSGCVDRTTLEIVHPPK